MRQQTVVQPEQNNSLAKHRLSTHSHFYPPAFVDTAGISGDYDFQGHGELQASWGRSFAVSIWSPRWWSWKPTENVSFLTVCYHRFIRFASFCLLKNRFEHLDFDQYIQYKKKHLVAKLSILREIEVWWMHWPLDYGLFGLKGDYINVHCLRAFAISNDEHIVFDYPGLFSLWIAKTL